MAPRGSVASVLRSGFVDVFHVVREKKNASTCLQMQPKFSDYKGQARCGSVRQQEILCGLGFIKLKKAIDTVFTWEPVRKIRCNSK